ncbi:HAD hydrolase family protein, partial [Patescibacteria group bacterium]|nr:HAD hydrolase family protein [Patescibacteria group bacterium]
AKLAKNRDFSETVVEADEKALKELKKKFNVVLGGKFIHIFGKGSDKGKAVKLLTEMYRKDFGNVTTIGIGNSYTDEPMLRAVDISAIVKNPDGNWADLKIDKIHKANGIGPKGWAEVVNKFVLGE